MTPQSAAAPSPEPSTTCGQSLECHVDAATRELLAFLRRELDSADTQRRTRAAESLIDILGLRYEHRIAETRRVRELVEAVVLCAEKLARGPALDGGVMGSLAQTLTEAAARSRADRTP